MAKQNLHFFFHFVLSDIQYGVGHERLNRPHFGHYLIFSTPSSNFPGVVTDSLISSDTYSYP